MSRHITIKDKIIWSFPANGGDDTALGLFQIPEKTGMGKYATVAFDQDKVLNEGVYDWKEVDPSKEPFDAEMYTISESEVEELKAYIFENTPKVGILKKIFGGGKPQSDFIQMLSAISEAALGNKESVFFSEP